MGIVERRERERGEVRRKILEAARELFMAEGYERVTMRRIAEGIEYSPTTIYNHFTDKDDLVNALCHEEFSRLFGALALGAPARDPVEWIRQIGRAYAAFGRANPNHYRFMFMTQVREGHEVSEPGHPRALFRVPIVGTLNAYRSHYAVTRDGQRFLVDSVDASQRSISLLVNWNAPAKP